MTKQADREIIDSFLKTVYWANETTVAEVEYKSEMVAVLLCESSVGFPCHWKEVDSIKSSDRIWEIAKTLQLQPFLIVAGDVPRDFVERLYSEAQNITDEIAGTEKSLSLCYVSSLASMWNGECMAIKEVQAMNQMLKSMGIVD